MENLDVKEIYYQEKNNFGTEMMYSLSLDSLEEKIVIVNDTKKSKVNKLSLNKTTFKLRQIQNIIQNYENNYISKGSYDGITYKIVVIMNDGNIRKIIGRNKFPNDFSEFKKLLSGD